MQDDVSRLYVTKTKFQGIREHRDSHRYMKIYQILLCVPHGACWLWWHLQRTHPGPPSTRTSSCCDCDKGTVTKIKHTSHELRVYCIISWFTKPSTYVLVSGSQRGNFNRLEKKNLNSTREGDYRLWNSKGIGFQAKLNGGGEGG